MDHEHEQARPGELPVSRRRLLKAAAFGAAAVAVEGSTSAWASAQAPPGGQDDGLAAFEGTLVSRGPGRLSVQVAPGEVRAVSATARSSFWKGHDTVLSAFNDGDDVLVRTLHGSIDRAWANLDRLRGTVTRVTARGYEMRVADHFAPGYQAEVILAKYTRFTNSLTGAGTAKPLIPDGAALDVIGLTGQGTIVANIIGYALPGAAPPARPAAGPDLATVHPLTGSTSFTYFGFASWFSCPTGAGRCGQCDTSKDHQTAWPAWDSCGCCDSTCCDCSRNCKGQARFSDCGHSISVHSECQEVTRTEHAVDCGPCQNCSCNTCSTCVCSHTCTLCSRTRTTPVVDLTKPSFALFYNPDTHGCFIANATVTV